MYDLGYYDYDWWAELHAADCRIVTRLKKNTPLTLTRERLIPAGGIATSSATILWIASAICRHARRPPQQPDVR